MYSSLFYAHLPALYIGAKDLVLISVFKTSLEVPSLILQLILCWDNGERQHGEEKTLEKGIKLKCHLQKWQWSSQEDGIIHLRT